MEEREQGNRVAVFKLKFLNAGRNASSLFVLVLMDVPEAKKWTCRKTRYRKD